MKIAFYHGLESNPNGEKNEFVKNLGGHAPAMNYRDESIWKRELDFIKKFKPDLLSGSSMGGWFAYALSTQTGIPTLLFNPAFHSRSYDPAVEIGNKKATHTVILGKRDRVIDPKESIKWMKEQGIGSFTHHMENIGHRSPLPFFEKWLNLNGKPNYESFNDYRKNNG